MHLPLWQQGEQHPAASIFIPQSMEFAVSSGSPRSVCHIYRLLGQGAEPWGIPAGSHSAGRQGFVVACRAPPCLPFVSPVTKWMAGHDSFHQRGRGYPPGPWAAEHSHEDQRCLSCSQAALVTRTWPGKPQLRKVTQGLAHGDNRPMGSPAISNNFLFGACLDFLEFESR